MAAYLLKAFSLAAIILALLMPLPGSAQSAQVQADTTKPIIEVRFARSTSAADFQRMAEPSPSRAAYFVSNPVYVSNKNVFTDSDFEHVQAVVGPPNGFVLSVHWKPDAAQRFAQILRGQVDAGIDQLAVFIDGELMMSSQIIVNPNAKLVTGIPISLQMVAVERARQIQAAVTKRWPRREH